MDTPALLAIDDVRIAAPPDVSARVAEFYTRVIGLRLLTLAPEEPALVFCGYSAVKPRLIVQLTPERPPSLRGIVQVRVASLEAIAEVAAERDLGTSVTQNLAFFDRRLTILDPGGNRVDLLAYHAL